MMHEGALYFTTQFLIVSHYSWATSRRRRLRLWLDRMFASELVKKLLPKASIKRASSVFVESIIRPPAASSS